MAWNVKDWSDFWDSIHKFFEIGAIIVGGTWVYFRFRITREDKWNLDMRVTADVLPYSDNHRLLLVRVDLQNVGNVVAYAKKETGETGEFTVYLYKVQMPQVQNAAVNTNVNKPNVVPVICDDNKTTIELGELDLLQFDDYYYVEPGATYHDIAAFIVERGHVYSAIAVFREVDGGEISTENFVRIE